MNQSAGLPLLISNAGGEHTGERGKMNWDGFRLSVFTQSINRKYWGRNRNMGNTQG